jgi:hypothetical protein
MHLHLAYNVIYFADYGYMSIKSPDRYRNTWKKPSAGMLMSGSSKIIINEIHLSATDHLTLLKKGETVAQKKLNKLCCRCYYVDRIEKQA